MKELTCLIAGLPSLSAATARNASIYNAWDVYCAPSLNRLFSMNLSPPGRLKKKWLNADVRRGDALWLPTLEGAHGGQNVDPHHGRPQGPSPLVSAAPAPTGHQAWGNGRPTPGILFR